MIRFFLEPNDLDAKDDDVICEGMETESECIVSDEDANEKDDVA